ncbi:YggS family pyridoxal phosphate-dependent enzyme [Psychromicrobium xiongbiense]|uniref:YggS family pyridoxal phosphate-dependent enzyme n=1 Tax=Psychromicrobium xiongbiense TaxID=3051184 RepID=UPI002557869F|nr:YggS family pyridoxal phosphate-dependent enzyme [Psychromicrobium sp. YIM S02556]
MSEASRPAPVESSRADELARRLSNVRARISASSESAGREQEPTLIVVTKFHPAVDVLTLAELGVRDVGESRDQEASAKAALVNRSLSLLGAADSGLALHWHFVGQLQANKARSVVKYAQAIHSVDRISLVGALSRAAVVRAAAEPLDCFIQVDLNPALEDLTATAMPEKSRGGALPSQVAELAARLDDAEGLRLAGVMAVAPLGEDPDAAFARLARISATVRSSYSAADGISAGMSGDLEAAVRHGATHLRIGSDVLGPRPAVG